MAFVNCRLWGLLDSYESFGDLKDLRMTQVIAVAVYCISSSNQTGLRSGSMPFRNLPCRLSKSSRGRFDLSGLIAIGMVLISQMPRTVSEALQFSSYRLRICWVWEGSGVPHATTS